MTEYRIETTAELIRNIPEELRQETQWVVWKLEQRDGKDTKVPYIAGGVGRASSTNSKTWRTFEEAVQAFGTRRYSGIGFVFSNEDPYTGIDLDECRNPDTGEITPEAQAIIDALDGYAEASPSGRGVHIIVRGRIEGNKKRHGWIEAYSCERYFTMTGVTL